jgi:hypothetical protein
LGKIEAAAEAEEGEQKMSGEKKLEKVAKNRNCFSFERFFFYIAEASSGLPDSLFSNPKSQFW